MSAVRRRLALAAVVGGVVALSAPAAASANKAWVSSAASPSAPFDSCAHPGYGSIQAALESPATTVEVCAGDYPEQLQITRAVTIVGENATVSMPTASRRSTTACDAASEAGDTLEDQDLVSICTSGKVSISGMTFQAIWSGNPVGAGVSCAYNLYGILVGGGGELRMSESTVDGAAPEAINGCQYGVGVQVGMSYASPTQAAKAVLRADTIYGYQKNGITVDGTGSEASIEGSRVTGAGPTPEIAQNGIGVQLGAKAKITTSTITRNECENASCGPELLSQYQSEGVYFWGAQAGSSIRSSNLAENDIGVETFDTRAHEPLSSQVTVSGDTIARNRDVGVALNQGWATVSDDVISESRIGLAAVQASWQTYGPTGTATGDTITGMSEWAVAGVSDNAAGDSPGSITIKKSAVSGNPAPTVAGSVHTDNPSTLTIVTKSDT